MQMGQRPDVVGHHRAPGASLIPFGAEHEVLNDQLAATVEQIDERGGAVLGVERVGRGDLHHRQASARGADRILHPDQLLLVHE
ncbi:MAG: hypothetical protein QOF25_3922, partial [Mycobacterium sp.]|nr:hypothetical protein [Mycobacterium sp.]